jgi:protein ImuB
MLRLEPEEVISAGALQLGLFSGGDSGPEAERAGRALIHVQGLLGPDAVLTGVLGGGRGPVEQVRWVPWGDERSPGLDPDPPWPGRLPAPSPTIVPVEPVPAEVFDKAGTPVGVSGRHVVTAVPHTVAVDGRAPQPVLGWAGPWPVDERWWATAAGRASPTAAGRDRTGAVSAGRRARLQVVLAGHGDEQSALLLVREAGRWRVEGVYE